MTGGMQKKQTVEKVWLHYFNEVLYERNIITERERNRMAMKIEGRKSPDKQITGISVKHT